MTKYSWWNMFWKTRMHYYSSLGYTELNYAIVADNIVIEQYTDVGLQIYIHYKLYRENDMKTMVF